MTTYESVSLFMSGVAVAVSFLAALWARTADKKANDANATANSLAGKANELAERNVEVATATLRLEEGKAENEIHDLITEAKQRLLDFRERHRDFLSKPKASLTPEEVEKRNGLVIGGIAAIEGYLNALNQACQRFLDGKVPTERFKKSWAREIQEAYELDEHQELLLRPGAQFHALRNVYTKWFVPE